MTNFVQYFFFLQEKREVEWWLHNFVFVQTPIWLAPMTNATEHSCPEWPHRHMTAPSPGLVFEEPCSSLSEQWVALSLREPTAQRVTCEKGLSLACFWHLAVVPRCCFHHALCVFLPTAAPVTVTLERLLRALTTGNSRAVLRCWPRGLTMSLSNRSVCHRGADKEMKSAGYSAIILC